MDYNGRKEIMHLCWGVIFVLNTFSIYCQRVDKKWPEKKSIDNLIKKCSSKTLALIDAKRLKNDKLKDQKKRENFASFSGISVLENGEKILLVTDSEPSLCYELRIKYKDKHQHIQKINQITFERVQKDIGEDAESLAIYEDKIFIAYDHDNGRGNTILILKKDNWEKQGYITLPNYPDNTEYADNGGIEAMTVTQDGQVLAIHEVLPGLAAGKEKETHLRKAWLKKPRKKKIVELSYHVELEEVKGATTRSNGNLLILEKTFDKGTKFCIRELQEDHLNEESKPLDPVRILETDYESNNYFDNFEGIASFVRNEREYILLISDDNNGKNKQKTLLFLFEIK